MGDVRLSDDVKQAAVIRPGDHLIVRVKQGSTREDVGSLLGSLNERFPDVKCTVIAAEEIAVYRPEASE